MRMNRFAALTSSIFIGTLAGIAGANAASDPTGVWLNDTGRGAIEIKDCGGKLCGHVVWVKDTADAAKGCGKQIIGDLASQGNGRWDGGWIYSPEKKRNYDVEVKPLDNGTLKVMGYAGIKMFSKTMIWTKAPDDLVRCTTTEAKADPKPATEQAPAPAAKTETPASTATEAKVEEPAKPEATEQAPAPATEEQTTAENSEETSEGGLDLEKFIKKTADGKCNLDTPWINIKFKCENL